MRIRFTRSFEIQTVEKVLERSKGTTVEDFADKPSVGNSTLDKWIALARQQKLEPVQDNETARMTIEKRPQDYERPH